MTRRGSIAYYMAAVVVGCFFMSITTSLLQWADSGGLQKVPVWSFFFIYFLSLVFGSFAAVTAAFLLRKATDLLGWHRRWQWVLAGATITFAVTAVLGASADLLPSDAPSSLVWLGWIVLGPQIVWQQSIWMTLPGGAATALILHRIDRAFEERT